MSYKNLLKVKMGDNGAAQDQETATDENPEVVENEGENGENDNANVNANENSEVETAEAEAVEALKAELEAQRATKEAILKEKRELEAALKEAKKDKKSQEIQELKERGETEKALELELVEAKAKLAEMQELVDQKQKAEEELQLAKKEEALKTAISNELSQFESFNQDATDDVLILAKSIFNEIDEKSGKAIGYDSNGNLIKNKKGAAYTVTDFLNENVEKRSYLFKQHKAADQKTGTPAAAGSMSREQFRISLAKISGKAEREKFIAENRSKII